jgi:hypothetical protein
MSEMQANVATTAEELAEVIEEFEQYRERLVKETLETAQKAKLSKTKAMSHLEPELAKIDTILQQLREQQATLNEGN